MILGQPDFSVEPTHAQPQPDSLFTGFDQGGVLLIDNNGLRLPTLQEVYGDEIPPLFELAHNDSGAIFSPHPFHGTPAKAHGALAYHPINIFRSLPYSISSIITSAWHLWNWYRSHRFCGSCGHPTAPHDSLRAIQCTDCSKVTFPVICPAIIVAITCGEKILLVRNARGPVTRFVLVAGYVEVGETLEHAVRREVEEEVGIQLKSLRYVGNQPWGLSGTHMFAFQADADDTQPIHVQESELTDARWFHRSELEPTAHTVSVAFELMERFRKGEL